VEINTAGTAIHTEFQKKGSKPEHCAPVQAESQAKRQASKFIPPGKLTKLFWRISSASLSEVTTITYKGAKKNAAPTNSVTYSNARENMCIEKSLVLM
jgi:hypothetical protein